MDVDPQNKKLANLHGDLSACEGDGPCQRYLFWKGAGEGYRGGYEIFEEGGLGRRSITGQQSLIWWKRFEIHLTRFI